MIHSHLPPCRSLIVHPLFPMGKEKPRQTMFIDINAAGHKRDRLLKALCRMRGVTMDELRSATRRRRIVLVRQEAMYFLRTRLELSYDRIAKILNRTDHTTAVHGAHAHAKRSGLPPPAMIPQPSREDGRFAIRWTPEMVERVERLAAAGLSSRQIAAEIGSTISAVSTACARRGIKLTYHPVPPRRRAKGAEVAA